MDDEKQKSEEEKLSNNFLVLVEWSAPEYDHFEKSSSWYWAVGIISIGFFLVAIILKNFLFAVLVIIGAFTLALYGAREPKLASFAVTSRGLKIEKRLYPFGTLRYFWINYDPPRAKEIYFVSKKLFIPQISIPLGHADPNEIREHLIKFLEEKEVGEPLSHTIAKFFRF